MKEIEVKILEIDKKEIIKKIKSLGAKKVFEGNVEAFFYDFSDDSLKKEGKILRLRKKEGHAELTFKESLSKKKVKTAEETEIKVSDFESVANALKLLGLEVKRRSSKYRISYSLKGVHFEIDKYPGIPAFLEIEAPNIRKIEEYVVKLGFSKKDMKPWTARDLFKHYKKERFK